MRMRECEFPHVIFFFHQLFFIILSLTIYIEQLKLKRVANLEFLLSLSQDDLHPRSGICSKQRDKKGPGVLANVLSCTTGSTAFYSESNRPRFRLPLYFVVKRSPDLCHRADGN